MKQTSFKCFHSFRFPDLSKVQSAPSTLLPSLLNLLSHSEGNRRSSFSLPVDNSSSDKNLDVTIPKERRLSELFLSNDYIKNDTDGLEQLKISQTPPRRSSSLPPLFNFPVEGPRKIYVLRHGERSDFCFQERWYQAFSGNPKDGGIYTATHLNMQFSLPAKKNGPYSHQKDPPLTRVGELQAKLVGEGFLATKVVFHHIYVSPALRCVMTATNLLQSMNIAHRMSLKVEPGLFEWHLWYRSTGIPQFMTTEELIAAGHNVDTSYIPIMVNSDIDKNETCEEYYSRNARVVNAILESTKTQGMN